MTITAQDLTTYFFKGETATLSLLAKNPDGTALSNPTDQVIIITIGLTKISEPLLQFDNRYTLEDTNTSEFSVSLTDADMDSLAESKIYYYNLWSKHLTDDPRLQSFGKFTLQGSITPT